MNQGLRRWLLLALVVTALLVLPACGGGEGERVTGDSPEGVPVDSALEDEAGEGADAFPQGSAGVADDEIGPEESLTDGQ